MENNLFFEQIISKLNDNRRNKNKCEYNYFNLDLNLFTSNQIYNNTLLELIKVFDFKKTNLRFLKLNLIISEEKNIFDLIDSYFLKNNFEKESNTTQKIKINNIHFFKQVIPNSIHSSNELEYLYIVFSKKSKEAHFIFKENATSESKLSSFKSTLLFLFCLSPTFHIVHGSSLSYNDKGILIIGPAGSGKTTVTIDLIQKGCSVISDNISYVSSGNLKSYFILNPPKLNLGFKTASYFNLDTDFFEGKKLFALKAIKKDIIISNDKKIDIIIIPVLDDSFSVIKLTTKELLNFYKDDFLKSEVVYLFTKLKLFLYFKFKTIFFWKKELKNKVILKITLDKNNMSASLMELTKIISDKY